MKARVIDYKIVSYPIAGIPPGKYTGIWGGYVVKATINGHEFELKTDVGIRTPAAPCFIHADEEGLTVETQ